LIPKKTLPTEIRALWYAASIISSLWFLYWICYDVFVWNKALTQVRPQNYVELTLAIALTILGTRQEDAGEYLHAERGTRVIGSRDNLEEM
jgi:hypothetical protein